MFLWGKQDIIFLLIPNLKCFHNTIYSLFCGISCLCKLTLILSHTSHRWSSRLSLSPPLSAFTEATTLFSRQSTLEDLDGMPECIPKTSERARPKLRKMYGLDLSNSSMDSGSSFMSRCLASVSPLHCTHLCYSSSSLALTRWMHLVFPVFSSKDVSRSVFCWFSAESLHDLKLKKLCVYYILSKPQRFPEECMSFFYSVICGWNSQNFSSFSVHWDMLHHTFSS